MHAIKIEEMMILNFVEHVTEFKIRWPASEDHVVNVFVKLVIVRGVLSDISP